METLKKNHFSHIHQYKNIWLSQVDKIELSKLMLRIIWNNTIKVVLYSNKASDNLLINDELNYGDKLN